MFFKTNDECLAPAEFLGFSPETLEAQSLPAQDSATAVSFSIAEERRATLALARQLVSWLGDFRTCLLWVTDYGIWPSSENLHLYYRLRSSYGDLRQLSAAPGHLFIGHETADLVTFVDLSIQFAWGAHLLTTANANSIFLSHDEWVRVDAPSGKEQILRDLKDLSIPI